MMNSMSEWKSLANETLLASQQNVNDDSMDLGQPQAAVVVLDDDNEDDGEDSHI